MYVEHLEPIIRRQHFPLILVHDDFQTGQLAAEIIERELTATAESEVPGWERAGLHDKWPGKAERESLAQDGLRALLHRSGKALLVGVGAGAVAAWLVADVEPDLVAGVVAIDPSGPPCGLAHSVPDARGIREYSPFIRRAYGLRRYSVTDIPMTFYPPLRPGDGLERELAPPHAGDTRIGRGGGGGGRARSVRKLVNLQKMRHAVVTSHAGPHTSYDWATVYFLRDAGLDVSWLRLEDLGILGNGHLMFLETNSDQVASQVRQVLEDMALDAEIGGGRGFSAIGEDEC
ncbi:hypothetical protein ESCO_005126 [Escovopsis weberi]|uniref:AB hydrolase-1 domain-containing protein n=1 Tax=Escovopsis weberi TaxID=150374 RepID=A0A0M8N677_ESCWE|nr:hypothetical protein ESCO_005126 [Escovopsis weberi]